MEFNPELTLDECSSNRLALERLSRPLQTHLVLVVDQAFAQITKYSDLLRLYWPQYVSKCTRGPSIFFSVEFVDIIGGGPDWSVKR